MATDALGSAGFCELTGFSLHCGRTWEDSTGTWWYACGFTCDLTFAGLMPEPRDYAPVIEAHQAFHDERDAAMHSGALEIAITLDVSDDPDYLLGEILPNGRARLIDRYADFAAADAALSALHLERITAHERGDAVPGYTLAVSQYGRAISTATWVPAEGR